MKQHHYRRIRHEAHTRLVLRYLSLVGYSSAKLLFDYFDVKNIKSIHTKLKGWEKDQFIERVEWQNPLGGRANYLYKLTPHGTAMARLFGASPRDEVHISDSYLHHAILCQQVLVSLKKRGYHSFEIDKTIDNAISRFGHYPDLLAVNTKGQRVAIEIERTIKSKARYSQIMADFRAAKKAGRLNGVIYVMPDDRVKAALVKTIERAIAKPFERKGIKISLAFEDVSSYTQFVTVETLQSVEGQAYQLFEVTADDGVEHGAFLHRSDGRLIIEPLTAIPRPYYAEFEAAEGDKEVVLYQPLSDDPFTTLDGDPIKPSKHSGLLKAVV